MPKLIFVSGPMTGIAEHNRPAFHVASAVLRAHGYYVISPAELRPEHHTVLERCTREDLKILLAFPVEGVATLPDGPEIHPEFPPSRGMAVERTLAAEVLKVPVRTVEEWLARDPHTGLEVSQINELTG